MDTEASKRLAKQMVRKQIVARGVCDKRVLAALEKVPRHRFISAEKNAQAYEDHPLPIDCQQTISQPYIVALMSEMLLLKPTDRVLEIGAGSGYQSAILAELAQEVISIERHGLLAQQARDRLQALGYNNIEIIQGDGSLGCPEKAPYDAIIVTAGSPALSSALTAQLAEGGRLVCPIGGRRLQELIRVTRKQGSFHQESGIKCVFVPLIGDQGWPTSAADADRE